MSSDYEQLLKRAKAALPKALSSGERFKVPEADIVVEGKTTILRNFADMSESIRRDPGWCTSQIDNVYWTFPSVTFLGVGIALIIVSARFVVRGHGSDPSMQS